MEWNSVRHNILDEFDEETAAVFNPEDWIQPKEGFPECLILTFTKSIVEKWAAMPESRQIGKTASANGEIPIYAMNYRGEEIAFAMAMIGASYCAGVLEDWIAMGSRHIVVFGSCGVLNREIADGHMIIPAAAVRDEGTSYHYQPPADEIEMDPESVKALTETMEDLGYPYVVGKTWTTDGFCRETRGKMERRKAAGCVAVDMECSALIALARFRGVHFAQFLYAADNLDSDVWEQRGLHINQGLSRSERYMEVAMEVCLRLKQIDRM